MVPPGGARRPHYGSEQRWVIYSHGKGVEIDHAEAARWFSLAGMAGSAKGQYSWAFCMKTEGVFRKTSPGPPGCIRQPQIRAMPRLNPISDGLWQWNRGASG